jgi:hypothetical protein
MIPTKLGLNPSDVPYALHRSEATGEPLAVSIRDGFQWDGALQALEAIGYTASPGEFEFRESCTVVKLQDVRPLNNLSTWRHRLREGVRRAADLLYDLADYL